MGKNDSELTKLAEKLADTEIQEEKGRLVFKKATPPFPTNASEVAIMSRVVPELKELAGKLLDAGLEARRAKYLKRLEELDISAAEKRSAWAEKLGQAEINEEKKNFKSPPEKEKFKYSPVSITELNALIATGEFAKKEAEGKIEETKQVRVDKFLLRLKELELGKNDSELTKLAKKLADIEIQEEKGRLAPAPANATEMAAMARIVTELKDLAANALDTGMESACETLEALAGIGNRPGRQMVRMGQQLAEAEVAGEKEKLKSPSISIPELNDLIRAEIFILKMRGKRWINRSRTKEQNLTKLKELKLGWNAARLDESAEKVAKTEIQEEKKKLVSEQSKQEADLEDARNQLRRGLVALRNAIVAYRRLFASPPDVEHTDIAAHQVMLAARAAIEHGVAHVALPPNDPGALNAAVARALQQDAALHLMLTSFIRYDHHLRHQHRQRHGKILLSTDPLVQGH